MSKKTIFLAIFSAGLLFSCQKAEIVPNQNNSEPSEEIVNRSVITDGRIDNTGNHPFRCVVGKEVKKDDGITDPNNDEDRNKKKKGNY